MGRALLRNGRVAAGLNRRLVTPLWRYKCCPPVVFFLPVLTRAQEAKRREVDEVFSRPRAERPRAPRMASATFGVDDIFDADCRPYNGHEKARGKLRHLFAPLCAAPSQPPNVIVSSF